MLSVVLFLFKGKRIPPTKTRPLRQGSKKPLLEGDLQAAEKIGSDPAPEESKSLRGGVEPGPACSGAQRRPLSFPTWAQKRRVQCEGASPGAERSFSDPGARRAPRTPTPASERTRTSPAGPSPSPPAPQGEGAIPTSPPRPEGPLPFPERHTCSPCPPAPPTPPLQSSPCA